MQWCPIFTFTLSQEVLLWIKSVVEECGENITTEQLKDYVWKTLNSGKVANPHFCTSSSLDSLLFFRHFVGLVIAKNFASL